MKTFVVPGLFGACALLAAFVVAAAEKAGGSGNSADAASGDEMMKKFEALATPGPGHKLLEPFVGDWDVEAVMWMGGQGSPEMRSKGSSSTRWVLGGRYLEQRHTGEMMGRKFEGIGITGYDNFRKKFFSTWMDSMSTGFYFSEGTSDAAGKTFTFEGKMDDPMGGQKDKPTKTVVKVISADKHVFEMHDLSLGDKSKVMEMTYTRAKRP